MNGPLGPQAAARFPHAAAQRPRAARNAPTAEGDALAPEGSAGRAAGAEGGAGAFAEADGAPGAPVFSEAVFGARLARALHALLAMQRADAAEIARGPRGPRAAIFTTPTGPSLFEADSLTLHFLCGGVSLAALVAHRRGALPHFAEALDDLEIADVRALLWLQPAALRSQQAARPQARPRRRRSPPARPWDSAGWEQGRACAHHIKIAAFRRVFRRA